MDIKKKSTWDAIDERRLLKAKKEQFMNTGKQSSDVVVLDANTQKDKEVKSRCRNDKKLWIVNKLVQCNVKHL